jgi:hypothetical protein
MQGTEIEKSNSHILSKIVEYVSISVVTKTIIRKTTGNISKVAIDAGEVLAELISPFDTFIQVIEGTAGIIINEIHNVLEISQAISSVKAKQRFKMISTVIKSGYE